MTARKIIYSICLLILLPLGVYSQDPTRAPKRRVVLPSGDTIVTSNKGGSLLSKDDMKFFKRDTSSSFNKLIDSLYSLNSAYNSLEDAAYQVTGILDEIEADQKKAKENSSLSVRLAQKNRDRLLKEKEAQSTWEEQRKNEDLSVEDMVEAIAKFGDKPTYYLNGSVVDEAVTNQLRPVDILSREFKIVNTVSRNPNGEIWFEVSEAVAQKALDKGAEVKNKNNSNATSSTKKQDEPKKEKRVKKKETSIKSEPNKKVESPAKRDKEDKKADSPKTTKKTREQILKEANDLLKSSGK
jgi:hypothetical protein